MLEDDEPLFLLLMFGELCFFADGLVIGPLTSTDFGDAGPATFFPADMIESQYCLFVAHYLWPVKISFM